MVLKKIVFKHTKMFFNAAHWQRFETNYAGKQWNLFVVKRTMYQYASVQ